MAENNDEHQNSLVDQIIGKMDSDSEADHRPLPTHATHRVQPNEAQEVTAQSRSSVRQQTGPGKFSKWIPTALIGGAVVTGLFGIAVFNQQLSVATDHMTPLPGPTPFASPTAK